jgi:imidazolonepropionase-like amidohydrolase
MVALRGSEQDSGLPIARGFQSGSIFTAPGGLPGALFQAGLNYEVQTPEEARVGVLDLVFQDADVIKIYLDPWAGRDFPVLQPEVGAAIVKEAHAQGLVVRAHVNKISMLETALDAGVDVLEHVPLPHPTEAEFREFLEHRDNDAFRSFSFNQMATLARLFPRLVAQGIIMVPTLSKLETSMRGSLIPEVVQPQVFQSALDTVGRFYELGGIVVLGTDHNANWGKPVGMPIREMELLLEAGLTRMDVICGATRHAAYVCGQGDELGTLENGKLADLVILEGDPLVDIHAFSKVRSVVLGGELI